MRRHISFILEPDDAELFDKCRERIDSQLGFIVSQRQMLIFLMRQWMRDAAKASAGPSSD